MVAEYKEQRVTKRERYKKVFEWMQCQCPSLSSFLGGVECSMDQMGVSPAFCQQDRGQTSILYLHLSCSPLQSQVGIKGRLSLECNLPISLSTQTHERTELERYFTFRRFYNREDQSSVVNFMNLLLCTQIMSPLKVVCYMNSTEDNVAICHFWGQNRKFCELKQFVPWLFHL